MSVTAGVSEAAVNVRDKLRGKIGQTKVKRYWPGKAPEWADDAEEDGDGDVRTLRSVALEKAFPTHEDSTVPRKDDRRLRRLAENRAENKEEVRADHRRIRQAEILSTIEEENNRQEGVEADEDDEDFVEDRRRLIRERQLQREREEAELLQAEEEDEEPEEEDESSEYETDSEEEQLGIAMVKPVFIPKSQRDTIAERERMEAEELRLEEMEKKRLEERKIDTKQRVVEEIRKDEEIHYESTLAGVAVDPSKPGFKLLLAGFYRPFGRLPQNQLVCQVFDSMSNSWTRLVFSHYDEFTHMNRNQVVYADGALHWLTQSCLYVFAFDVSDCVWKKIQLPDEVVSAREGARAYLLEMEGAVSVIRITGVWMCIWVLVDPAGERWSLADRVHLRCIGAYAANVFPVSQTREVVFLASQKKVFTYGRREKVWREIYAMDGSAYPLWFSAHSFRGTLFSCH